ncbi:Amino acid ABC transporter, substrate-binding protein [Desulfonema limicola]|uniref:Amino acid ABC transporter, substrate-binding protein n=1 Tax=Desulfonema limicola TaxID=45656 RepID=A0A975BDC6_9BACT|nr:iron ABC transporter substrate-binding protein [Desulfonema limicola]QTA83094.1 Amino acid ABC transporter, substrate-binding protein [Desulfonema limicola]
MKIKYLLWGLFIFLCQTTPGLCLEMINVQDMAGRIVKVPHDPARIVCLGPGTLRLIVYLNAWDRVAGVEDVEKMNTAGRPYLLARKELGKLPRIGPGGPGSINKKPDMEAVLSAGPQVIFVTYMDKSLAQEVQKTLGIPVIVLSYGDFATLDKAVYDSLIIAGKILNLDKRAEDIISYIESIRQDLQKRSKDIPEKEKPGVYVGGIGHRGAHGIESTEASYIPLNWNNAVNMAEKADSRIGSHVFADKETLLKLNPDIIFIDGGGLTLVLDDFLKKPQFYRALKAFQNRRIYTLLPFNSYTTNIGTALADAYAIGKILYPERFTDIDLEKKTDEIYTFLLGKPVYGDMKKQYRTIGDIAPFLK